MWEARSCQPVKNPSLTSNKEDRTNYSRMSKLDKHRKFQKTKRHVSLRTRVGLPEERYGVLSRNTDGDETGLTGEAVEAPEVQ